jgi:hypothetical protein
MMKVRDAVVQVLPEAGQPLHAQEIATLVLAKKFWQTTGKTPDMEFSVEVFKC